MICDIEELQARSQHHGEGGTAAAEPAELRRTRFEGAAGSLSHGQEYQSSWLALAGCLAKRTMAGCSWERCTSAAVRMRRVLLGGRVQEGKEGKHLYGLTRLPW